jgi:hypothetical protein
MLKMSHAENRKGMSTAHWLKMHKFESYLPADGATTKADDAGVAKVKIHKPLPKAQLP